MSIRTIAAEQDFEVVAWGHWRRKKWPKRVKVPPPPGKYDHAADGKAGGILKLAIKWAEKDKDEETRKVMTEIVKAIRDITWKHLSEKKQQELMKL